MIGPFALVLAALKEHGHKEYFRDGATGYWRRRESQPSKQVQRRRKHRAMTKAMRQNLRRR